ncbi:MAG TPA: hypothetical protein VG897_12830 [Terriglobales bacterium]|nr:hypothetical protein [Terriglobales bacterium]
MNLFSFLYPHSKIPLEQQLENLAECGIRLKPEFSVNTLLESYERGKYEERPYVGAVIRMGGETEREPFRPLSDSLWHLNTRCIDGPGSYAFVAIRMRDLAQGDLPIENIRDHVDAENGDAWVAFEIGGETVEWHARIKEDWIDPEILANFCSLLSAQNTSRRYTYMDLKGDDCIIGCATEDQLRKLRKMTGMNFGWLA